MRARQKIRYRRRRKGLRLALIGVMLLSLIGVAMLVFRIGNDNSKISKEKVGDTSSSSPSSSSSLSEKESSQKFTVTLNVTPNDSEAFSVFIDGEELGKVGQEYDASVGSEVFVKFKDLSTDVQKVTSGQEVIHLAFSEADLSSINELQSSSLKDENAQFSSSDWELILVNRQYLREEMSPNLTAIEGVTVDSRIAQATTDFLAAARSQINGNYRLISGYRSVAYQEELFQGYVSQEMANGLSHSQAVAKVQTYSQPAGASEHQTGLAIDVSETGRFNSGLEPQVAENSNSNHWQELETLAIEYGFIHRFKEGKKETTGIAFEDWHFRYVGVEAARYMYEHQMSLEEFVQTLSE